MPIDGAGRKRQSRSQPVADSSDDTQVDETIEPERPSGTDHFSLSAKDAERGERPLVVYLQLRDLIVRGTIAPGTPLIETELADRLSVSRTPIRGALQRLRQEGLIERQIALLSPDRLAAVLGHGLQAVIEISLDRQDAAALDAFEARVIADDAVQQCWRVSPGPEFVLVVAARDMPDYGALAQRLFTADANVRNVKAFFSLKRAKFEPKVPLAP